MRHYARENDADLSAVEGHDDSHGLVVVGEALALVVGTHVLGESTKPMR